MKKNNAWLGYLIVLGTFLVVVTLMYNGVMGQNNREISYSQLWELIDAGQVKSVAIRGTDLWGLKTDTTIPNAKFPEQDYDFETTVTDIESFRKDLRNP